MKTLFTLLLLISLPLLTVAQSNTDVMKSDETTQVIANAEKDVVKKSKTIIIKSAAQNKAMDLNHKKSFELISIKAYRKSLQIKVKTVKNC